MKAEFKKDLVTALKDFDLLSISQLIVTAELSENEIEAVLQECIDHGYYLGSRDAWETIKIAAEEALPRLRTVRFTAPTADEVTNYAARLGHRVDGKAFVQHYESRGWKDSTGRAVKNWKGKVRSVWCREENRIGNKENYLKPKIH
jgi:hypothetical protein